jgi:hypothetical protein
VSRDLYRVRHDRFSAVYKTRLVVPLGELAEILEFETAGELLQFLARWSSNSHGAGRVIGDVLVCSHRNEFLHAALVEHLRARWSNDGRTGGAGRE